MNGRLLLTTKAGRGPCWQAVARVQVQTSAHPSAPYLRALGEQHTRGQGSRFLGCEVGGAGVGEILPLQVAGPLEYYY